jgi:hypothetical protein
MSLANILDSFVVALVADKSKLKPPAELFTIIDAISTAVTEDEIKRVSILWTQHRAVLEQLRKSLVQACKDVERSLAGKAREAKKRSAFQAKEMNKSKQSQLKEGQMDREFKAARVAEQNVTGKSQAMDGPPIFQLNLGLHQQIKTYPNDDDFTKGLKSGLVNWDEPWAIEQSTILFNMQSSEPLQTTLKSFSVHFPRLPESKSGVAVASPLQRGSGDKLCRVVFDCLAPPSMATVQFPSEASATLKGISNTMWLTGYSETVQTTSHETLGVGVLHLVCGGIQSLIMVPLSSWVKWCSSQSGVDSKGIKYKQLVSSFRAAKTKGCEYKCYHLSVAANSAYWVPDGWLVARRAGGGNSMGVRRSYAMASQAACENMKALVASRAADESREQRDAVELGFQRELAVLLDAEVAGRAAAGPGMAGEAGAAEPMAGAAEPAAGAAAGTAAGTTEPEAGEASPEAGEAESDPTA